MLPTTVTVLSAMDRSLSCQAAVRPACLRRTDQAAAGGLGVGQADELVADDVVRESERTLEVVERPRLGDEVEDTT